MQKLDREILEGGDQPKQKEPTRSVTKLRREAPFAAASKKPTEIHASELFSPMDGIVAVLRLASGCTRDAMP